MVKVVISAGKKVVGEMLIDADRRVIDDTAEDEGCGGIRLLEAMAIESTLPDAYEWTGHESYEIV